MYLQSLPKKRSLHGNKKIKMNAADEDEVIAVQLLLFSWFDSQ